jgi:hypothetical protein
MAYRCGHLIKMLAELTASVEVGDFKIIFQEGPK